MQLTRCPICHSRISLEALVQDEAGRELLRLISCVDIFTGSALIAYLGLFRSPTRDLSNAKALKLAEEVMELTDGNQNKIGQPLRQTVDSLRGKGGKPLTNHNYLKRVLEDCNVSQNQPGGWVERSEAHAVNDRPRPLPGKSKTSQALQALAGFGNE